MYTYWRWKYSALDEELTERFRFRRSDLFKPAEKLLQFLLDTIQRLVCTTDRFSHQPNQRKQVKLSKNHQRLYRYVLTFSVENRIKFD